MSHLACCRPKLPEIWTFLPQEAPIRTDIFGPKKNLVDELITRFGFQINSRKKIQVLRQFFAFLHPNGIDGMNGTIASRRSVLRLSTEKLLQIIHCDEEKNPNFYTVEKFHEFLVQSQFTESLKLFSNEQTEIFN